MPSSGQFLGRGPSGRILNNAFKLIERIMRSGIFEQTPKGMHLIGMSSLPRETAFILLELPKWNKKVGSGGAALLPSQYIFLGTNILFF